MSLPDEICLPNRLLALGAGVGDEIEAVQLVDKATKKIQAPELKEVEGRDQKAEE